MEPDTGESTASILRRMADRAWPDIERSLREGGILRRPAKLRDYYTEGFTPPDRRNGRCLPVARVRKLEREGVLVRIGVDTYGLADVHGEGS